MAGKVEPYRQSLLGNDEVELDTDSTGFEPESEHSPAVEVHNLNNKRSNRYHGDRKSRRHRCEPCCSPTSCALIVACGLLGLGVGYLAGIFTNIFLQKEVQLKIKARGSWRTRITDYGTESCVRLVDADGDGIDDVIIGMGLTMDIAFMLTADIMEQFCRDHGMEIPCAGSVIALRGYDGKLLWQARTYAEIFELNCHSIDVNRDGIKDCIATGRLGDIRAINIRNGDILWASDENNFNRGWNIYSSTLLPDFDYDGVPELVISHGGDPTISSRNHTRRAGWLMMLSGATGQPIGRPLEMPEDKETYCVPVIHTLWDGSSYILYGSGGETVGGLLMAISVPDFYRYVHKYPRIQAVPNVQGDYKQWGSLTPGQDGVIEIFRSEEKGVMVPPVLVDMTDDTVKDILMSAFDGTVRLIDGQTMQTIWEIEVDDRESYSTPSPGYFNDDDVLDFMIHWSRGAWPFYNGTDAVVLDGRDGSVLWNLTTHKYDVSSDLLLRTTERNRDVFLFKTQGRQGYDPLETGAIHGATGIQRIITRQLSDNRHNLYEREIFNNGEVDGVLLPEYHFREMRNVDEDFVECASDQTVYTEEMFAVDRTTMSKPLKLWDFGSEKYYYKLTEKDRKLVEEVLKKYGENYTTAEDELPWARGKRDDNSSSETPFCIVVQPDGRTTGALGDVDGDGRLDVIINVVSVGVLRDEYARFVKMKFNVDIFKITLDDLIQQEMYTPVNVSTSEKMNIRAEEKSIKKLKFLPKEKQVWGGYLGTSGNSIFRNKK